MTADELRHKYIDFFERHGHVAISGRSLIPENDPTVLFTTAGMHPLVPYILGEEHPAGTRLVNCQKCIRTGDIDAVGDRHHLTFFEMLGNWSLGDYFKEEAITLSWRFLTEPQWLGIPAERLLITLFAGDRQVPADSESAGIWRSLGVPDDRIRWLGRADNWWGPAGKTGPCGPDTEMFIDTGGAPDSPADDRYLEVWNDVFMQYNRIADGSYERLERRCVDTGMGLERMIAVLQGCESVYDTDLFAPLIADLSELTGARYRHDEETDRSTRIICDHLKAAVFIIGDEQGVSASNIGRGYILRRLLRRAVRHGRKLSMEQAFLHRLTDRVVAIYRHAYPQLGERREQIADEVHAEERRFLQTLRKGEQEFAKLLPTLLDDERRVIPGEVAFRLYDTFGFPLEITIELAAEHGLTVDAQDFERRFHEHRRRSKADDKSTFKGGLADSSVQTTRLHSATHLLHQALRDVLGDHVAQRGSNITVERLRFDFTHPAPMTAEERLQVERIVNRQIGRALPIECETMSLSEARRRGAIALFGDKYREMVKVYRIGDYSMEVCGGPHVDNSAELGRFRIVKEQSSSQGVRRIKATLEPQSDSD